MEDKQMVPEGQRPRAIDQAMSIDSPEKSYIRLRWVDVTRKYVEICAEGSNYLYLSLPGRRGRDLEILHENGILTLTETGALSEQSQERFVAVEKNEQAAIELQKKFPGLKVVVQNISAIVRGHRSVTFPKGEDARLCRSLVINLDFEGSLNNADADSNSFPLLTVIKKMAELHSDANQDKWALFLTFNATINWCPELSRQAIALIDDNRSTNESFRECCGAIFGGELSESLTEINGNLSEQPPEVQQRFFLVFVPKKIAESVISQRWIIEGTGCYRYSSGNGAPMASWILRFSKPDDPSLTNQQIYRANISRILEEAGEIDDRGDFHADIEPN